MMELKPCVFCGHTETEIAYDGNCYTAIECKLCRARGPLTDGPHLAEIGWNTRAGLEDASQAVPDCAGTTTTGLGERHRTGQAWEVKNEDSNA